MRRAAFALGVASLLALGACGASRLAREPAAPVDLSGRWLLDPAASDDPARAIAAALPKPQSKSAQPREAPTAADFLHEFVVPADYVELRPGPAGALTIVQGERRRTHELASEFPPSVTDRYGSRVVRAGWEGRALVVVSEGAQFRLRERFEAGPLPDTLAYRVELRARGLKDVDLAAFYRRTDARPAPRAPLDGPPAPRR